VLKLLALLDSRIQDLLDLADKPAQKRLVAVRTVLNKYDADPEVQHAINEITDVLEKMREIKG
jgi:hypothetical protein